MEREPYNILNKGWKTTCKILFGEELGELQEYDQYLKEAMVGKAVKSDFSGKELWVASEQYCNDAKFFDYANELELASKELSKPINVNKIKDIDSLVNELQEKIIYCGNKTLGNSKYVEYSDDITDSVYILNSANIVRSKYMAYCYLIYDGESNFAVTTSGESTNCIRCFYNNSLRRCFEIVSSVALSDCYFCFNIMNSGNCMFSFNLRAKQNVIGNVQLSKDQYNELKNKLLGEMIDELKTKKRLGFSIVDILNGWKHD
ncbi:hypothetical protein KKF81_02495 [Candidatus Micrarchaeota archaeon]|nr:hypothetical protein [Candidatus Micrarchaeota archaeon]MBU1165790.1 hypothetical protein [Candidatus Micrarchaeota archaeon]MBU1886294.1 hypothetical protein [Candidatus Micrarchaeota archaeon]